MSVDIDMAWRERVMRLERLAADPNLAHTGARWRAHEAAFPGSGATERAEAYAESDRLLVAAIEEVAVELRKHLPNDDSLVYVEWCLAELAT